MIYIERQTDRQRQTETDRQTDRQRQTERGGGGRGERERERERERGERERERETRDIITECEAAFLKKRLRLFQLDLGKPFRKIAPL